MSYTATTEPLRLLAWDIKTEGHMTRAVVHFGTAKSVAKLKRAKRLPTYEEVTRKR